MSSVPITETELRSAPARIAQFADELFTELIDREWESRTAVSLVKVAMPEIVKAVTR